MKRSLLIFPLVLLAGFLLLLGSCSKDEDDDKVITVTDQDGNEYCTVTIGSQVWMAENLRTTKFNDGTTIPPFPPPLTGS